MLKYPRSLGSSKCSCGTIPLFAALTFGFKILLLTFNAILQMDLHMNVAIYCNDHVDYGSYNVFDYHTHSTRPQHTLALKPTPS